LWVMKCHTTSPPTPGIDRHAPLGDSSPSSSAAGASAAFGVIEGELVADSETEGSLGARASSVRSIISAAAARRS